MGGDRSRDGEGEAGEGARVQRAGKHGIVGDMLREGRAVTKSVRSCGSRER